MSGINITKAKAFLYYLASPLSHPDPKVEFSRVEEVLKYFSLLLRGEPTRVVYIPLSLAHGGLED